MLGPDSYEPPWAAGTSSTWLRRRAFELTYTAWDLCSLRWDCGWAGPPFRWDEERRFLLRCELDAAFFHLYLPAENGDWHLSEARRQRAWRGSGQLPTPRDAVAYVMDTFPIVRRKDEEKMGRLSTKRVILEIYDAMQRPSEPVSRTRPASTRHQRLPSAVTPRRSLGILAFGSLIGDPGPELASKDYDAHQDTYAIPSRVRQIQRKTRGGAPTLVPHDAGGPVRPRFSCWTTLSALPMRRTCCGDEKHGRLARARAIRRARPPTRVGETYYGSPCVSDVLYTDFHPEGKIERLSAEELAKRAIQSVDRCRRQGRHQLLDGQSGRRDYNAADACLRG